ncbi:hypothetical protein FACS189476_03620 [Spirochaetia bacterium]|nr:hypothetical protein FACS189476_03620 [Spirochaetia bacterium]
MLEPIYTNLFKKDYKLMKRRHKAGIRDGIIPIFFKTIEIEDEFIPPCKYWLP